MKILLATDGSDYSKAAVEELASRPLPPNTEVYIVSAFESYSIVMSFPEPGGGPSGYYQDIKLVARKAAEEAAEEAANFLRERNSTLTITTAAIEGAPKHVILNEAESFGADLIVVGSHGGGGVERFLLGSVSQAVALHAKCSVEIVRKRNLKPGE